MFKYFTKENTRKYIDVLPKLIWRYNNAFHRSIKMKPVDVNRGNAPKVWINLYEKKLQANKPKKEQNNLKVGDTVHISIERLPFQKRYEEIWTEEIFIISHKIVGKPTVYKLKDQGNESIKGTFYFDELQKVSEPSTYRIERVIRKKKNRDGSILYYVKWKGYSDKFNSYVTEEDIEQL